MKAAPFPGSLRTVSEPFIRRAISAQRLSPRPGVITESSSFVTGPSTDNQVGRDIIIGRSGVEAINGITNATELGDAVAGVLKLEPS